MTARRPLVNVAGQVQELPQSDSILGAVPRLLGTFPGVTASLTGTTRFYPSTACTITSLTLWAGANVPSTTTASLMKNGVSVGTASIASGQTVGVPTAINVALATTDYLTINLTSTGAADVVVRIDF